MRLSFVKASKKDADVLVKIYNEAFYDDYITYGECPAYGKTKEQMEVSIEKFPKLIILHEDNPVGVISVDIKEKGVYYISCLGVIPAYQGRGIGKQAFQYFLDFYNDWKKITLITPADKEQNIKFYTEKCGFIIDGTETDGNVKMLHFTLVQ
jgi:ribosomal protein S18 acetylase RimI-like enzyme